MSSESLADVCLGLAAVHAVFVTIALVSGALVLQGYVEARLQAEAAANRIVVEVQVLLARVSPSVRQMYRNGVFDEGTLGELAAGWTKWNENGAGVKLANERFHESLGVFRAQRRSEREALVQQAAVRANLVQHERDTLEWEATWLPLRELLATGEIRLRNLLRFEGAAARVRSTASWSPVVAVLVATEVAIAIGARVTIFGPGEMPVINVAVAALLGIGNAVVVLLASYIVVRTVGDLVADIDRLLSPAPLAPHHY